MNNVEKLPLQDFTRYCMSIAQVPSSYISGLTMEEQLLWLCSYLTNEVIPAVNNNGEAVEELQTLYVQLKDYVDNYFDNLDIQQEVNTKLEAMAQSGELAELISQYLEAQAIIGFNTCSSLASAENLANGSFAKTYGQNAYNDKKGAFYKVRQRLNSDDPDGYNLIVLTNTDNLVAQKISNSDYEIEGLISNLDSSVDGRLDVLEADDLTELVVIGDSYTAQETSTWAEQLAAQLHLTLRKHATSSMGYVHEVNNETFIDHLNDETEARRLKTKYLICYGGINDASYDKATLKQAVKDFCTSAKTMYPNTSIIIVGPQKQATNSGNYKYVYTRNAIYEGATESGVAYADPSDWLISNPSSYTNYYKDDNQHPNALGCSVIASKMLNLICGGNNNNAFFKITPSETYAADSVIKSKSDEIKTHINWRIDNFTLNSNSSATLGTVSNYAFISNQDPLMVVGYSTSNAYFSKLIGFVNYTSNGGMKTVNISGSNYSGRVFIVGDIYSSLEQQYPDSE